MPTRLGKSTQQDPISDLYNSLIKKILSDKLAQEIKMTESRDSYVIAFNNLNTQIDSAINKDTLITLAYDIDQNFGRFSIFFKKSAFICSHLYSNLNER